MKFTSEKGLALCGLACVLCREEDCPGCKARGCGQESDCTVLRCATERGLDGCYACPDFPCGEKMLRGVRKGAFNRYAQQFGKEALLQRLRVNAEAGIAYHHPDKITGDYDRPETEQGVLRLIHFGSSDPYADCPRLQTERFTLRLVRPEDAAALLRCYSDPRARPFFNADNCISDFCFETEAEMRESIGFWLDSYEKRAFIRFTVEHGAKGVPLGTVEMFGKDGGFGILRLDLASLYETRDVLGELLRVCVRDFYLLFGVCEIRTKIPLFAAERMAAAKELGFCPLEDGVYWSRREAGGFLYG